MVSHLKQKLSKLNYTITVLAKNVYELLETKMKKISCSELDQPHQEKKLF